MHVLISMALTITFIAPPPRGPCHLYQARIDPTLLPSLAFFFFFSTACTNRVTQPLSFVKRYSDPWNRYPYITKFPTSTAPRHGTAREKPHTQSRTHSIRTTYVQPNPGFLLQMDRSVLLFCNVALAQDRLDRVLF